MPSKFRGFYTLRAHLFISLFLILTQCSVLNLNHYQDGKTLGKGNAVVSGGLAIAPSFEFELDSARSTSSDEYYSVKEDKQKGILNIQLKIGALNNLDAGFNLYSTFGVTGGSFFSKWSLLPPALPLGMAVFGELGGASTWGSDEEGEGANYGSFFFGIGTPISVHPYSWLSFYIHPQDKLVFNTIEEGKKSAVDIHTDGLEKVNLIGGSVGIKFTPNINGDRSNTIVLEGVLLHDSQLGWVPSAGIQFESTPPFKRPAPTEEESPF